MMHYDPGIKILIFLAVIVYSDEVCEGALASRPARSSNISTQKVVTTGRRPVHK